MSSENAYLCKIHNKKYVGYCQSCNVNICLLCTSKHEKHELLQYNEIQPSSKKVEELKQEFIEYKKNNQILISKFNLWLEKINHYSTKIIDILKTNEKIYENIFSNYDTNNLIFADIDNMNQIRKKGLILGYKNINLNLFENEEKILEKSDLIFKTIKEMQIEDIFFSIKNEKNILNPEKRNNTEQEQKEMEDNRKEKKTNKKSKTKKNKKTSENELLIKKYEEYKEINLKSNYFDTEYLINLSNSNSAKTQEENKSDLNSNNFNNTNLLNIKSIHNGREINNITLISHEEKKYIVTCGYCYINLYDIKGQLQRSIKLHESDITNLIQLKNGDILSCCIDGTMKIIRLGKNEGYNVIQVIDTKQIKQENKNNIFSNNQLYVLLQIYNNETIVTAHGNNLLFYSQSKKDVNNNDNKEINYELNQILAINIDKKENDYDFIINNKNISSLLDIKQNNNFIALNNSNVFFIEEENNNEKKYFLKDQIKNICANGGPNNIILYNTNTIIIGGGNKIYFVNIKEKTVINEIKMDFSCINSINMKNRNNNESLFIGYENKENQYNIGIYNVVNKDNKYDIKINKEYKNVHNKSISSIIPINYEEINKEENKDNVDNENNKFNLEFISGAHDKFLKYWE